MGVHPELPEEPLRETDGLAGQGDSAFFQLYERLAPTLLVWASLRIPEAFRRHLSPEDVMQEAWFQASRSLWSFDAKRGSFRAWMTSVTKNVLLQAVRRLRRPDVIRRLQETGSTVFSLDGVPAQVTTVSRKVREDESLQRAVEWVRTLARDDQELVVHCGLEGMKHEAVGNMLGLSCDAVHKRWQRLRARLEREGLSGQLVGTE